MLTKAEREAIRGLTIALGPGKRRGTLRQSDYVIKVNLLASIEELEALLRRAVIHCEQLADLIVADIVVPDDEMEDDVQTLLADIDAAIGPPEGA